MTPRKREITDRMRLQVAARDGVICQYCGDSTSAEYHADHVVPFAFGGPCVLYNLVLACESCNARKRDAVWVPHNLDALTTDNPAWRAQILTLAAQTEPRPRTRDGRRTGAVLIPIGERVLDLYGDSILVYETADGGLYAPLQPITTLLGLAWHGQLERIKREPLLASELCTLHLNRKNSKGGRPEAACLPLHLVPGWLFGISVERIRPELRAKITHYRQECFRLLAQLLTP